MPSTLAFTTLTLSLFLAATTTTNALPWNFKAFNRQQYSPPSWVPRNFVPANPTPAPYISGPELTVNFPDPCIIAVNGTYYSFATGSASANIPIAYSTDFVNWQLVLNDDGTETDALPIVGDWVNMTAPNTWAPDVSQLDDGKFVMYYSATALASPGGAHHCVSAATSDTILGPYIPLNNSLICPLAQGGAIDAAGFKDWSNKGYGWGRDAATWNGWGWGGNDPHNPWIEATWSQGGNSGERYIVYKVDGNSLGHGGICGNTVAPIVSTPIMLQPVAADGITLQGAPVTLLDNQGLSDSGVTEAPSLVKSATGEYVLFFSRDCYSSLNYTVSYATAENANGPYTRRGDLLLGGDNAAGLSGTGGASVLWDGVHMVFHANALATEFTNDRLLHTAIIDIEGTTVTI